MSKFFVTLLLLVGLLEVNAQASLHRYFIGGYKGRPYYEFTYRTSVEEGKPDRILVEVDNSVVDSVHVPFNIIEKVVKATSYLAWMNLRAFRRPVAHVDCYLVVGHVAKLLNMLVFSLCKFKNKY